MADRLRANPANYKGVAVLLTAVFVAARIPFAPDEHISGIANGAFTAMLAAAVWAGASLRLPGALGFALLFLGEISYSLYLVHDQLGFSLLHLGTAIGLPDDLSVVLALTAAVAISAVINKCVERPAQRWITKKYSSMRATSAAQPEVHQAPRFQPCALQ
jgi:peptidoglycan/LPS O-acetylase OafA/YrhL